VVLLTEASDIAKGKATFEAQCVTCHGASGEGKVGPNLTDKYWKHGGDIKDLFKTVKLGVSGTGMKSWKSDLSPMAIAQVTSYILTLQGTNPAGGKAPEGDLYVPKAAAAPADTTVTAAPADTTGAVSTPAK
jgi:cytochrome c oxidase cbb3-type subunit 3